METEIKPLLLVHQLSAQLPGVWEELEKAHSSAVRKSEWNTKMCYLPIGKISEVVDRKWPEKVEWGLLCQELAAAAPWRIHKQIFKFEPEMEKLLMEQQDDMRVPTDVLYSMPYPCIYIQTSTTDFGGFFVHFEDDLREGYGMELRFLLMYDGHELPLYLHLKSGATIYDGIKEGQKESRKNAAGWNLPKISQQQVSSLLDGFERIQKALIPQLLQLILYICAENKEVRENSQQAKIHRAPSSPKYIKDKPREIQSWDLGTETAIRLRSLHTYREPSESATPRSGSSAGSTKAPHVRRAHWHHFWTGKHGSKERKRVLKWVAPSFIHANGSAESPFVTVTGISAKKKEEN